MKVLSVAGYHHTGKTTVVVNLIKELRKRGYSVSSIKDIHAEKFTMEKEGSNSWKHWEASGNAVIARGLKETYQIWHEHLSLQQMLAKLNSDWVIVEGIKSAALPRIICAENTEQLAELVDGTVFAISGKYGNEHKEYKDLKVYNSYNEIAELTDLVERKVFKVLPLPKQECCGECGFSCRKMVELILQGKKQRSDCKVDGNPHISITIDGKNMDIVPYVQKTFKDIITAYLQNLKGYRKGSKIKIEIEE